MNSFVFGLFAGATAIIFIQLFDYLLLRYAPNLWDGKLDEADE